MWGGWALVSKGARHQLPMQLWASRSCREGPRALGRGSRTAKLRIDRSSWLALPHGLVRFIGNAVGKLGQSCDRSR